MQKINSYYIFKEKENEVKAIVRFFTSNVNDTDYFREIQKYFINKYGLLNVGNLKSGFINKNYFADYVCSKNILPSISISILNKVLKILEDNLIISRQFNDFEYYSNKGLCEYLKCGDKFSNIIFGKNYIYEKYKKSIFKIEVNKNNEIYCGTGFLHGYKNKNDKIINFLITNKHNLENIQSFRILDSKDSVISHNNYILSESSDLAVIILDEKSVSDLCIIPLNNELLISEEIMTIGYPNIPGTKFSEPIIHSGEINGLVTDYLDVENSNCFLFSSKTTGGNSGSPIIDSLGCCVGIVTKELFQNEELMKSGKLPYYAGIDANRILTFINNEVVNKI